MEQWYATWPHAWSCIQWLHLCLPGLEGRPPLTSVKQQTPCPPNNLTPWRSSGPEATAPVNRPHWREICLHSHTHSYLNTHKHIKKKQKRVYAIKHTKGGFQNQTGPHKPDEVLKNPSWGCSVCAVVCGDGSCYALIWNISRQLKFFSLGLFDCLLRLNVHFFVFG